MGCSGYLSFLVAFADDGDGVDDGVDVVAFDGGDLADPEAGVGGEQDHRPGPLVHPGVEQDGEVFVGDRAGPAFLDLRGGGDGGGVVGASAGDDEPFAPGPDRAVVVGPGGLGPGGGGQEPVHALRGDCGGVGDAADDGRAVGDGFVGHAAAALPEHPVLQQLLLSICLSQNIGMELRISADHPGEWSTNPFARGEREGRRIDRLRLPATDLAGCSIGAAFAHQGRIDHS